ncbi:Uncharacterised protein [uncultured Eubacterium sp.]|nr:Uncharacterised protein [uncultured Eubacterium sp.]
MRKVVIILSFVLCLLFSTTVVLAGTDITTKEEPINGSEYVTTDRIVTAIDIVSGNAACETTLKLKPGQDVDYAQVTAYIKKSTGSTVKTFNEKVYPAAGRITWSDSHKLASRGTYYLQVIVKCYRNGKLIETLKETSKMDTY